MTQANPAITVAPIARTRVPTAALCAFLLGTFLLYGVGFASPNAIHNAAHDGRHAHSFPCH